MLHYVHINWKRKSIAKETDTTAINVHADFCVHVQCKIVFIQFRSFSKLPDGNDSVNVQASLTKELSRTRSIPETVSLDRCSFQSAAAERKTADWSEAMEPRSVWLTGRATDRSWSQTTNCVVSVCFQLQQASVAFRFSFLRYLLRGIKTQLKVLTDLV